MQITEHYIIGITGSFASDRILNTLETLEIEPNMNNKKAPSSTDIIRYNPEPGKRIEEQNFRWSGYKWEPG